MPRKDIAQATGTVVEPKCNICQSSSRAKVDRLVAAQFTYKSIAQELIDSDAEFSKKELDTVRKNVERHAKRHVDIRSRAVRAIVERRAKEQGILLDHAEGQITNGRALLDLIVGRATEQLAGNPDAKVRYQDALEAVKQLEDVQRGEYQAQLELLQRQVMAISTALKNVLTRHKHYDQPLVMLLPEIVQEAERIFDLENPDTIAGATKEATKELSP